MALCYFSKNRLNTFLHCYAVKKLKRNVENTLAF